MHRSFIAMATVGACASILTAAPRPAAAQQARYAQELRTLAERPPVREALARIAADDARTMADLREFTEIPAPPFGEAARARRFLAKLRALGVDTAWIDETGNVIGRRGGSGSGRVVAVAGHLDTVFPEETNVTIREHGDTLFAPGISDDTRGLAAVLALLRAMNEAHMRTDADVLFVATVGEEGLGDLRGVKHLFREGGPRIDAFISIDGTGDTRITHEALGSHRYRVRVRGPGGHSWGAFGLANPAHALGRAMAYFDLVADAFTRSGPRTSYNVGRIGGGTSVNSIPFEAWMEVDMRSESPESLVRIDSLFHRAVRRGVTEVSAARRSGPELTVDFTLIGDRPSGAISADDPFVQRAIAATRYFGLEPRLNRSSTDANVPISLGIPALTVGGGGEAHGAHSPGEWYINRNGPRGIQRVLLIVLAQAGLATAS